MTDPPRSLATLHVLLVEDDERVRDMGASMVEHAGARVTGSGNGSQALDALQQAVPDVVVTDINMPGASGLSVMRTIRRLDDPRARTVPAIGISGYGDQLRLASISDAGFNGFLGKPVRMEHYVRAVGRAAGRVT
jgi:CheY-like chemotaxis protein